MIKSHGEQGVYQEQQLKLHMLTSLARSQRALTQMLEAVAEMSANSKETAQSLAEHIDIIAKYHKQLTARITGISMLHQVRRQRTNNSGKRWLNPAMTSEKQKQAAGRR